MLYKKSDIMKKIKFKKKIKIQKNVRNGLAALLCIILLFSIFTVAGAYQESTTTSETVSTYSYTQNGMFDFTVNLKNNSVYNKTSIKPGQGTIFKSIVDDINGSFIYSYRGDEAAETTGEYYLTAQLKTDLWEKNYVIISRSNFSSNKKTAGFNFVFPVNVTFYEAIIAEIDKEIGIKAKNPTLNIKCNIVVSSQTSKGYIYDSFSPSINVSLGTSIIEFGGDLSQYDASSITREEKVFLQGVIDNRNTWFALSILFTAILIGFLLVTDDVAEKYDKTEKLVNKIKKKYGEWIVEVEKLPERAIGSEIINVKSLEDLIKTSEELGKPVVYSTTDGEHTFQVFDDDIHYTYVLPNGEKLKKVTSCPKCGTGATCKGFPGQKTSITCPNCGNKGIVTFEEARKPFLSFKK